MSEQDKTGPAVDEFHGVGGSYVMQGGKRVRVEKPSARHKDGDGPRDRDEHGKRLDVAPAEDKPRHTPAARAQSNQE